MVSNFDKILFIILKACTCISLSLSLTNTYMTQIGREREETEIGHCLCSMMV